MEVQTGHVLQKLFSEESLENISVERLKEIVEEHPYFTLGHFLLAKKLGTINAEEFEMQAQKAALYFNEPIWLQALLYPSNNTPHVIRERDHNERESEHGHIQELTLVVEVTTTADQIQVGEEVDQRDELYSTEVSTEEIQNEESHTDEVPIAEQTADEPLTLEAQQEERNEPEAPSITAEESEQEVAPEATPIFEPYHTIDYFASQGIKISNELRPNDRLGQQLRSFTEWLKTMKRFPETQIEQQLDEVGQQNIQEFASHSLDDKEVVTESMAEVLLKQYKYAEAVTIYEKLSLLNPSKRAYFAAKIEKLKGS